MEFEDDEDDAVNDVDGANLCETFDATDSKIDRKGMMFDRCLHMMLTLSLSVLQLTSIFTSGMVHFPVDTRAAYVWSVFQL